ncbi:sodium- and chloride-dependent neutral and basic amino acid transporter B(0+) isoform X1 [Aedes aegypti]|uniref:Uncharacterized protein n=1 Tax=Aedes aegypti TaxID=7159 RepID=A0A6I8TDG1_AEDAE|nr:sodium- and chloride-dependent neutral and basic amino acid transporter B(0+) isoform X1 [Aedes aegypti]XP_021698768.1 sodium- and chloride-dependent neutral and basic amino acid transporter B(0+) isoform X1 [Aedes aegypti]
MKWNKKPKQSISSVTSMSFLSDENLTFHRFSDGTISFTSERKKSAEGMLGKPGQALTIDRALHLRKQSSYTPTASTPIWTTHTAFNNYTSNTIANSNHSGSSITDNNASTTTAGIPTASDLRYLSSPTNANNASVMHNGSTVKLLSTKVTSQTNVAAESDDHTNKQSRSSIFRGVILCLCLNLTYANVARFPRELQQHGSAFLVPYVILLLLVGLPVVLLEISLGQFLGQGSAHMWRAAPFLKGASLVGRIASWLAAIWTSMHSVIALLYVGMLSFKSVPFRECNKAVTINQQSIHDGYDVEPNSGQECLKLTFLRPVWRSSLYFGLLALSLILLWVISMVCTHSGKINRRSIYLFGFLALVLLIFETGWEVTKAINDEYVPGLWPFYPESFADSTLWFNALVQVIYSLNIGIGAVPVITGQFLYKGDAIKTSFVYIFFNILITSIAVIFYVFQFHNTANDPHLLYPELTPLTSIYDRAVTVHELDHLIQQLIPALGYALLFISSIVSMTIYIYTSTRMIRKHPNYTVCLAGLVVAIAGLLCPNYIFPRILDTRIVGSLIVCAMIFEIILIIWVYGSKNLYTDLEFSLGRPVLKAWLFIWGLIPVLLISILSWWTITYFDNDLLIDYFPKWLPVVFSLGVIMLLACVEISKQVDYNIFSMIHGATKPSKDWGPADPLVRHAWKQWKSVCEDTGERDFTLRRRGTKDYTNSIKKGQYSHSNKYGVSNKNLSTAGSNSPNYSGSVFGDSAIEEDISVEKFPQYKQQNSAYSVDSNIDKSPHTSASSRKSSQIDKRTPSERSQAGLISSRKTSDNSFTSRIEIMGDDHAYRSAIVRNPLAKADGAQNFKTSHHHLAPPVPTHHTSSQMTTSQQPAKPQNHQNGHSKNPYPEEGYNRDIYISNGQADHICWRKFSINSEEYSTEL